MAPPSSFEDERECRIDKRFEVTYNDIVNMYFRIAQTERPQYSLERHMERAVELTNETNIPELSKLLEKNFEEIDSKLGILSMTEFNNSCVMWDYYANHGTGFCVGFDTHLLFPLMRAGARVHYYDKLPMILIEEDSMVQVWKQLFCKELKWQFEQEYRTRIYNGNGLNLAQRLIQVPKECIVEVIFGYGMSDLHKNKIYNVCKSTGLTPAFYQTTKGQNAIDITRLIL